RSGAPGPDGDRNRHRGADVRIGPPRDRSSGECGYQDDRPGSLRDGQGMSVMARGCGIVLLLVLTLMGGLATDAPAQDDKLRTYNKNPIIISGQIRLAREHEQRAMELIGAAAGDPATLEQTKAIVYDAYVL